MFNHTPPYTVVLLMLICLADISMKEHQINKSPLPAVCALDLHGGFASYLQ